MRVQSGRKFKAQAVGWQQQQQVCLCASGVRKIKPLVGSFRSFVWFVRSLSRSLVRLLARGARVIWVEQASERTSEQATHARRSLVSSADKL